LSRFNEPRSDYFHVTSSNNLRFTIYLGFFRIGLSKAVMSSDVKMFPGFTEFNIAVSATVTIYGLKAGTGPPLLLLHGFPQTHHIWHKIAPELTSSFTIILMDLRGYGKSSKPPSSESEQHKPYSKSVMATDCTSLMSKLGFERFSIVSHDRGARIAHKLCVDFPDRVERVMLLDIAPTLAMFEKTDQFFATAYWHWFFLIQPAPFPEKVLMASPSVFEERFFGSVYSGGTGYMSQQAKGAYLAQFENEAGVHAMCEDYRAAAGIDLVEAREDRKKGRKIKCPVRVLWGKSGVIEKSFDCLGEWRSVSEGIVTGEAVESGHYIAEQVPDVLSRHVREFFAG
jgi:haloacetate dehalogenase